MRLRKRFDDALKTGERNIILFSTVGGLFKLSHCSPTHATTPSNRPVTIATVSKRIGVYASVYEDFIQ